MIKNILALIGTIVLVVGIGAYVKFGSQVSKLDAGAMSAYMNMFGSVLEQGDPATAMMLEFEIEEDVTNEDAAEYIKSLAEEFNMRITGDIKMYTKDDAGSDEVKHARILSLCSLHIAKVFLNHSRGFGGFMPCRIMLVEYGNGKRYLVSMDLTLAIYGGHTLPPEMLELAQKVQKAMIDIPSRAAKGDF